MKFGREERCKSLPKPLELALLKKERFDRERFKLPRVMCFESEIESSQQENMSYEEFSC